MRRRSQPNAVVAHVGSPLSTGTLRTAVTRRGSMGTGAPADGRRSSLGATSVATTAAATTAPRSSIGPAASTGSPAVGSPTQKQSSLPTRNPARSAASRRASAPTAGFGSPVGGTRRAPHGRGAAPLDLPELPDINEIMDGYRLPPPGSTGADGAQDLPPPQVQRKRFGMGPAASTFVEALKPKDDAPARKKVTAAEILGEVEVVDPLGGKRASFTSRTKRDAWERRQKRKAERKARRDAGEVVSEDEDEDEEGDGEDEEDAVLRRRDEAKEAAAARQKAEADANALRENEWREVLKESDYERTVAGWDILRYAGEGVTGARFFRNIASGQCQWDAPMDVLCAEVEMEAGTGTVNVLELLNPFAYEGLDHDEDARPWIPPTLERARAAVEHSVFGHGRASLCTTKHDELNSLGPGVTLYLRFVKTMALLFAFLALLNIPAMFIYGKGDRITSDEGDFFQVSRFTLGNIGQLEQGRVVVLGDDPDDRLVFLPSNQSIVSEGLLAQLTGAQVSTLITGLDLIGCFCVALVIVFNWRRIAAIARETEQRRISAKDFTVFVRGLPIDATEAEIREYFSARFGLEDLRTIRVHPDDDEPPDHKPRPLLLARRPRASSYGGTTRAGAAGASTSTHVGPSSPGFRSATGAGAGATGGGGGGGGRVGASDVGGPASSFVGTSPRNERGGGMGRAGAVGDAVIAIGGGSTPTPAPGSRARAYTAPSTNGNGGGDASGRTPLLASGVGFSSPSPSPSPSSSPWGTRAARAGPGASPSALASADSAGTALVDENGLGLDPRSRIYLQPLAQRRRPRGDSVDSDPGNHVSNTRAIHELETSVPDTQVHDLGVEVAKARAIAEAQAAEAAEAAAAAAAGASVGPRASFFGRIASMGAMPTQKVLLPPTLSVAPPVGFVKLTFHTQGDDWDRAVAGARGEGSPASEDDRARDGGPRTGMPGAAAAAGAVAGAVAGTGPSAGSAVADGDADELEDEVDVIHDADDLLAGPGPASGRGSAAGSAAGHGVGAGSAATAVAASASTTGIVRTGSTGPIGVIGGSFMHGPTMVGGHASSLALASQGSGAALGERRGSGLGVHRASASNLSHASVAALSRPHEGPGSIAIRAPVASESAPVADGSAWATPGSVVHAAPASPMMTAAVGTTMTGTAGATGGGVAARAIAASTATAGNRSPMVAARGGARGGTRGSASIPSTLSPSVGTVGGGNAARASDGIEGLGPLVLAGEYALGEAAPASVRPFATTSMPRTVAPSVVDSDGVAGTSGDTLVGTSVDVAPTRRTSAAGLSAVTVATPKVGPTAGFRKGASPPTDGSTHTATTAATAATAATGAGKSRFGTPSTPVTRAGAQGRSGVRPPAHGAGTGVGLGASAGAVPVVVDPDQLHSSTDVELGFERVVDVRCHKKVDYLRTWVADVAVVRGNGRRIRAYLKASSLVEELRRKRAARKLYSDGTPRVNGANPKKQSEADRDILNVSYRLEELRVEVERALQNPAKVRAEDRKCINRCLYYLDGGCEGDTSDGMGCLGRLFCGCCTGGRNQPLSPSSAMPRKLSMGSMPSASPSVAAAAAAASGGGATPGMGGKRASLTGLDGKGRWNATGKMPISSRHLQADGLAANQQCWGAFVTFNHEESFLRCVDTFATTSGSWFGLRGGTPELLFRDQFSLHVEPAPDPSEILWENLDTSDARRQARQRWTFVAMVLALVASFAILLFASLISQQFAPLVPNLSMCETEVPAVLIGSYANISRAEAAIAAYDPSSDPTGDANFRDVVLHRASDLRRDEEDRSCAQGNFHLTLRHPVFRQYFTYDVDVCKLPQEVEVAANETVPLSPQELRDLDPLCPNPLRPERRTCPCAFPASTGQCLTLPCFKPELESSVHTCRPFAASTMTGCYCSDAFSRYVGEFGTLEGTSLFLEREGDLCFEWAQAYTLARGMAFFAAFTAMLVNLLLQALVRALVRFERHVSLSEQSVAQTARITLAQIINTGFLILIVHMQIPDRFNSRALRALGIFQGAHGDFTSNWYATVGATLTSTLVFNSVVPHLIVLVGWLVRQCGKLRFTSNATIADYGTVLMQSDLNYYFVGPPLDLAARYPQMLMIITVCLMYSPGIPFLNVVALGALVFTYAVDWFLLLRYRRKPPAYTDTMARFAATVVPFGLVLHIIAALIVFSRPDLLPSRSSDGDVETVERGLDFMVRATRDTIAPFGLLGLFLLFLLTVFVLARFILACNPSVRRLAFFRYFDPVVRPTRKWLAAYTAAFAVIHEETEKKLEHTTCGRLCSVLRCLRRHRSGEALTKRTLSSGHGSSGALRTTAEEPFKGAATPGGRGSVEDDLASHATHATHAVSVDDIDDHVAEMTEKATTQHALSLASRAQAWQGGPKLSRAQIAQGWRLEFVNGLWVYRKVALESLARATATLRLKATWEVLADAGIPSYDVRRNPTYRPALLAQTYGRLNLQKGGAGAGTGAGGAGSSSGGSAAPVVIGGGTSGGGAFPKRLDAKARRSSSEEDEDTGRVGGGAGGAGGAKKRGESKASRGKRAPIPKPSDVEEADEDDDEDDEGSDESDEQVMHDLREQGLRRGSAAQLPRVRSIIQDKTPQPVAGRGGV